MSLGPRSLTLRLLALYAAILAASLALFAWQLSRLFEHHVERRIHAELENHMLQLIPQFYKRPDGRFGLRRPLSDPRFTRPYSGFYWQVDDAKGKVLARSRSLWDTALQLSPARLSREGLQEYVIKGPRKADLFALVRGVWLDAGDGERRYIFTLAVDHGEISTAVDEFRHDLYLALALLAGVLLLGVAGQIWLGLKPLRALRGRIARIRAGKSRTLPDEDTLREIRPLTAELNALLAENRKEAERARARAADLAHGMKTPLAILAAQGRDLKARGAQDAAAVIHQQVRALSAHVEHELARARMQGKRHGKRPQTPVRKNIEAIIQALEPMTGDVPLTWHVDIPPDALVPMERGDFLELAGNLLENAAKWARGHVSVSIRRNSAAALALVIEDDGPGVPQDRYDEILQRGRRLDEKTPGTGLGLAIVKDLAQRWDFELRLFRAALGGLGVAVVFR